MERLAGKVAIVTGAAGGIGAAYAKALAAEGAAVTLCDIESAEGTLASILATGGRCRSERVDITNRTEVMAVVERTMETFGAVDILVNNAAIFGALRPKPFAEIDPGEWDRVMAVNVRGSMECARAVAPAMKTKGYGKIVNVASGTVFKGTPFLMHYVASKGAVIAMTRVMARELGCDGIRVNCIAPGLTMSEAVMGSPSGLGAGSAQNAAGRAIPRDEVPDDVVGTLIYLCSPDSDFVTGQTILVDGGSIMH